VQDCDSDAGHWVQLGASSDPGPGLLATLRDHWVIGHGTVGARLCGDDLRLARLLLQHLLPRLLLEQLRLDVGVVDHEVVLVVLVLDVGEGRVDGAHLVALERLEEYLRGSQSVFHDHLVNLLVEAVAAVLLQIHIHSAPKQSWSANHFSTESERIQKLNVVTIQVPGNGEVLLADLAHDGVVGLLPIHLPRLRTIEVHISIRIPGHTHIRYAGS
jgi:hypothetical protein